MHYPVLASQPSKQKTKPWLSKHKPRWFQFLISPTWSWSPEQVHGCQLAKMFAVHLKSTVVFVAELGNKIPLELHNTMFSSVGELFEFPIETKRKVTSERPFHGLLLLLNACWLIMQPPRKKLISWPISSGPMGMILSGDNLI